MFPFPSILQHYIEFDICIITTLEKLLGVGSFGSIIGHLACCQAIFFAFSDRFTFLSIVQTIAPAFLGCWALIALAFIICF
jgi:hypothetical protein